MKIGRPPWVQVVSTSTSIGVNGRALGGGNPGQLGTTGGDCPPPWATGDQLPPKTIAAPTATRTNCVTLMARLQITRRSPPLAACSIGAAGCRDRRAPPAGFAEENKGALAGGADHVGPAVLV